MLPFLVRHRLVLVLLLASTLIGAVCAKMNTSGNLVVAGATAHVTVDDPDTSLINRSAVADDLQSLRYRAQLYANLITTPPVIDAIGKRAGVPPSQISGVADITVPAAIQFKQAGSEQHASELVDSTAPYRLELQAETYLPILTIYAEAPSVEGAQRLADSATLGLQDYLRGLAIQQGFPAHEVPQLRQLGTARAAVTNSRSKYEIAGLTFLTAFALTFLALFLVVRRPWRRRQERPPRARGARLSARAAADWPRTTRVLPWAIAGLIGMFWLTPFDRIQLAGGGAPINITLDRIVLPFVAVIWLIAFKAGPGAAPRLRITRVHIAVGAYLACAFLSVVLDAHYLNHTGELTIAVKKVPLLVSYVSVFVIVASSIRRSEVNAFMTLTLVLSVIVAVGVIYEYRSGTNIFTSLAGSLFKGPFKLLGADATNASVIDSLGRRTVEGPAAYGVELVMMLSIALPIAVLRLIKAKTKTQYLFYGLAIALLLYAMLSTDRKSALVAPVAVFITLAYVRRRQLLSLAPLGLVMVVIVVAISPGSVRNVLSQYTAPNASHVATVDSRTANFDAIRPDLWTHLLLGRGQGTYATPTDRVVDSDIILPLVETGVLGLVTFLLIPISLILVSRKAASSRNEQWSPHAVCGVTAGVCFLALITLYSMFSLPHGPDVFFYFAGLVVVATGPRDTTWGPQPATPGTALRHHQLRTRRRGHDVRRDPMPTSRSA